MKLEGKTVVVTGAGSGIGRELTLAFLAKGARVAGVDLNAEGLEETARRAGAGERLSLHTANITDRAAVEALPAAVEAAHGSVDAVINNAGVIQPFVDFKDLDMAVIDRMIDINLHGTINMVKAFLPALLARPEAHLANVASMGGFLPFPGQTMYSASKAAVKLLTEGLYSELYETNLGVSVIMPGAVATDITKNSGVTTSAGADAGAAEAEGQAMPAPEAAKIIVAGIEAGKLHILVGRDAKMLNLMVRIAPGFAIRFIRKMMKKAGIVK